MSIFKTIIENGKMSLELKNLRKQNIILQNSLSFTLSNTDDTTDSNYRGSPYYTTIAMINALSKKYKGTAKWGNQIASNIIAVRGTFTMGSGITVSKNETAKAKDLQFAKDFIEHNELDKYMPIEIVKEAEIEGRTLLKIIPDKDKTKKMINIRHISYTQHGYDIKTSDEDYLDFVTAEYKQNKSGKPVVLKKPEFVYRKFGGRLSEINDAQPKIGTVLVNMENIDKALWDLRKIDHYFASPTPTIETENAEQAQATHKQLKSPKAKRNWKVGKLLVTAGKYRLAGYEGAGVDNILKEIEVNLKLISGQSGVPVHFLGFTDLLSNRATAENLLDMLEASTTKEREIWQTVYKELLNKAMEMSNEKWKTGYTPDSINIEIPFVTGSKLKDMVDIWLPLYLSDVITIDTMLGKIPNLDTTEEKKALEKATKEKAKDLLDSFKKSSNDFDAGEEEKDD